MKKYGPYDGQLVIGDVEAKTEDPFSVFGLSHLYYKLVRPEFRRVSIYSSGECIGFSDIPAGRFDNEKLGNCSRLDVKFNTVGADGLFDVGPLVPVHRIAIADNPQARGVIKGKAVDVAAYNIRYY